MDSALFAVLAQGFKLWNTKEGNKYRDDILELRQEYSDELLKPDEEQSDLTIIRIQRRVRILTKTFIEHDPAGK